MLKINMVNLGMLYVHFKEKPLTMLTVDTYRMGSRTNSNIAKDGLKSKQIEIGCQIQRQRQLLSALLFEGFPYYVVCFYNYGEYNITYFV